jgi:peptide/nickel transport system substrate-binding protein
MTPMPKRLAALAVAALAATGLAACGKSSSSTPNAAGGGPPTKPTGTLHIVANGGMDHMDTVPAYYTADYMIERAYARQLLSYPTVPTTTTSGAAWTKAITPVPDVATAVPTKANGGISADGLTYTFHIKPGVQWGTSPARQVTAADFIREFKAFFNPVSPVGNGPYFTSTIAGLSQYSAAEAAYFANKKAHPPTAAVIAAFQNSHTIAGISAPDPMTLQIKLIQPASDFAYMMAMPFTSARPVEYDAYVPNSLQLNQHIVSDGPYSVTALTPGKTMTLSPNPAWKQSTDTLRHQYLKSIVVTMGVPSAATQLAEMQAGTEDLPMDTTINPPSIPGLLASKVTNFKIFPWSNTLPYVVFNLRSPDGGGAAGKLLVRQAIEAGLNKSAVQKVYGGPAVSNIINTAVPPGSAGYQPYNLYPDNNGQGNITTCKQDLTKAGYPHGVTLTYLYPNDSVNTQAFAAVQASLKPCGVNLTGKPEISSSFFVDLGNAPENNKPNHWDLAQAGWIADWFGSNNGRTTLQPLYQTNCVLNTTNYGCYHNPAVDSLIKQAETNQNPATSPPLWHQVDIAVMKAAVIVPLISQQFPLFASTRVHEAGAPSAVFSPTIGDPDPTVVWVTG